MTLSRRRLVTAAGCTAMLPSFAMASAHREAWRTFDVTTRVQLKNLDAPAQLWLPLPSVTSSWQEPVTDTFSSNGRARIAVDTLSGARMVHVVFDDITIVPTAEVTSRVRTRDRLAYSAAAAEEPQAFSQGLRAFLKPTAMIPTDGIVRQTALQAIGTARKDGEKTRAIYDWVAANTHREPSVRGCGEGDVRAMLESGNLSGKCVDLNSLFIGLCRAVGVPARHVYGLRLAPSSSGYRELGANPARLDGAQHCRAEVYLQAHGWVPMDPADVAKVMRQETPEWIKSVQHAKVRPVYERLFGSWEGNWLAWNDASEVHLPGSRSGTVNFLMYPTAEVGGEVIDSYSPAEFAYGISAREA